jgi:peptidoglycan hydrolase-like protein with peptidoglycan-binding domain
MKRVLTIMALTLAAACSHERAGRGQTTVETNAPPNDQQTAVVQPSDLSSEQVRLVQRALSDRGFAVDLSGSFDDRTQTALMDFQRARGLPATGNLNQPTVDALGIDPTTVMPVRGKSDAADRDDAQHGAGSSQTSSPSMPPASGNTPSR